MPQAEGSPKAGEPLPTLIITLPVPSIKVSPNGRGQRRTKHRHTKRYRALAVLMTKQALNGGPAPRPVAYSLSYHWSTPRRDDDNAIASAKAYMDGICVALGIDDRTLRFRQIHHARANNKPRLEITLHLS